MRSCLHFIVICVSSHTKTVLLAQLLLILLLLAWCRSLITARFLALTTASSGLVVSMAIPVVDDGAVAGGTAMIARDRVMAGAVVENEVAASRRPRTALASGFVSGLCVLIHLVSMSIKGHGPYR